MTTAIGSLLVQPQVLARMARRSSAEELTDEAVALAHRIALDPQALAAVLPALRSAGDALGARLAQRVQARLPQGLAALRGLLDPLVARFVALGAADDHSAPALLGRIAGALDGLADATGNLSDDSIRAFVRRVVRIGEQDFGLSLAALVGELRGFVADWRSALESDTGSGQAATRAALGCLLARIDRDLLSSWQLPAFDADLLANLLIAELRRTGLADLRDRASCLIGKAQAVLRALADLARAAAASGSVRSAPSRAAPRGAAARAGARSGPARAGAGAPAAAARAGPGAAPARARAAAAGAARSQPVSGDVPPRSADGTYCWYASWLYATRRQGFGTDTPGGTAFLQTITPGYPEDEVWLSTDRKTLVLRRAAGNDEVLHRAEQPFEWHRAPQFSGSAPAHPLEGADHAEYFTFPRLSAPFLEEWARATAILAEIAAAGWHFGAAMTGEREYACNIPLMLWKIAQAAGAAQKAPLASLIAQAAGWNLGPKWPFSPLVSLLMVILGSLEGVHTRTSAGNGFLQWLTLLGADAISAFTIHTVTQAARSFSLALFTLINYEGPDKAPATAPDTRPSNWDMAGPVTSLVNTLLGMLTFKLIRREDHGLPIGGNPTPFLLWMFIGAPVGAFVATFSGVLVGWGIARTVTPAKLWQEPLKAAGFGLAFFLVQLYLAKEGDTDDGRYNPTVDPQGNAFATPRQPFAGYPDGDTSPYRLPLAAGAATFVGQANQGFFSHMRYGGTVQVYAYDFAHDFGDEILAVRGGTVVDWFDSFPDDTNLDLSGASAADTATAIAAAAAAQAAGFLVAGQTGFNANLTGNWNFILIRHDTQDPAHDRDQGGTVVTTYAEYGHGRNGGVRAAFAARGIAPAAILGSVVQQGHVVMLAGDTGVSFHNHLHLHVRAATAATAAAAPVNPNTLSPYTLPFVFREARRLIGRNGPLHHLTWYRSENTRLG